MGLYLNSRDAYFMYKSETEKPYFVDKSMILKELFPLVEEGNNFVCITRPRRFGKTVMANMIGAFFSHAADASGLFGKLNISGVPGYHRHLNQHDVIYIDFSEIDDACSTYASYIGNIKQLLREDMYASYPDVAFRENGTVMERKLFSRYEIRSMLCVLEKNWEKSLSSKAEYWELELDTAGKKKNTAAR